MTDESPELFMGAGWVARNPADGQFGAGAVVLPADAQAQAAVDEVRAQRAAVDAELSEVQESEQRAFLARQLHGRDADLSLNATLERARVEMEQGEAAAARREPAELERLKSAATHQESAAQRKQREDDELIARARKRWAHRLRDRVLSR